MTGLMSVSGESRKPGGLAEFQEAVASLMHVWNDQVATNDDPSPIPVFLDLLSGPKLSFVSSLLLGRLESSATN